MKSALPFTNIASFALLIVIANVVLAVEAPSEKENATSAQWVLGAGCFWCVEAVFEELPGVLDVVSGYAGGAEDDANYQKVSSGRSGHIEVVRITFDPQKVSTETLLETFWKIHDPTDPRGVWPDFGPHYRSVLFFQGAEQEKLARASAEAEAARLGKPLATLIKPLETFYPAEEYHQDYVQRNPQDRYVQNIALPKLKKARP
ncbi:MAG: peptide-methionine (S)-S-oxide reductase MsrA [Candidatus Methylacidiphilales bacterium]